MEAHELRTKYGPRELRARIKAALRRTDELVAAVSFGDMEVDFERVELRRGDVPIDLTPIEFKLLSACVRSPGRVLSRQQLLARYASLAVKTHTDLDLVLRELESGFARLWQGTGPHRNAD